MRDLRALFHGGGELPSDPVETASLYLDLLDLFLDRSASAGADQTALKHAEARRVLSCAQPHRRLPAWTKTCAANPAARPRSSTPGTLCRRFARRRQAEPLRILQVSRSNVGGGAERVALELHRHYRLAGHDAILAVGQATGLPASGVLEMENRGLSWSAHALAMRHGLPRLARLARAARTPVSPWTRYSGERTFGFLRRHVSSTLPGLPSRWLTSITFTAATSTSASSLSSPADFRSS